jgi:hypothetical protein
MATKVQLQQAALHEMEQATIKPETWANRIQNGYNGKPYNYKNTHNYKAQTLLFQAANTPNPNPAPTPAPIPHDLSDVQRCLILTGDVSRALDTRNRLLIATADLGYRQYYPDDFIHEAVRRGIFRVWCDCRPSPGGTPPSVALQWLDDLKLPHSMFYGQCESMSEWDAAYDAGARRMVGNLSALDDNALAKVASSEVHVTNEAYFNVNRYYSINWRNANNGVGSNCMATYASVREGATYYSLEDQHKDGKYNPWIDCVYVADFRGNDWDYVIAH